MYLKAKRQRTHVVQHSSRISNQKSRHEEVGELCFILYIKLQSPLAQNTIRLHYSVYGNRHLLRESYETDKHTLWKNPELLNPYSRWYIQLPLDFKELGSRIRNFEQRHRHGMKDREFVMDS